MNLSTDIIFRLIFSGVMTIIVVRLLWFIVKSHLERHTNQGNEEANLDTLIEQKKRLFALNAGRSDEETQQFIAALQWGELECFTPIIEIFQNNFTLSPSIALLKKAVLPLNRQIAKGTTLKNCSKEELINILCILTLHILSDDIQNQLQTELPKKSDILTHAIENKSIGLKEYLSMLKDLPHS